MPPDCNTVGPFAPFLPLRRQSLDLGSCADLFSAPKYLLLINLEASQWGGGRFHCLSNEML